MQLQQVVLRALVYLLRDKGVECRTLYGHLEFAGHGIGQLLLDFEVIDAYEERVLAFRDRELQVAAIDKHNELQVQCRLLGNGLVHGDKLLWSEWCACLDSFG